MISKCKHCDKPRHVYPSGWKMSYCKEHYNLKRRAQRYGLTLEQTLEYLKGSCGICGTKSDLAIDHCHTTGEVRGTLCRTCNGKLGWYEKYREKVNEWIEPHRYFQT